MLVVYNTKISEIKNKVNDHTHDKYITTPEFNTLAARVFNARLAQANSITKTDFDTKLQDISKRIQFLRSCFSNILLKGLMTSEYILTPVLLKAF